MDYDVAVTGLSSPPPSAVLTPYRPAVSVRNNGLHAALASGYVRIYSAGLLIFESEVYSGTLAPGATGTADALEYWTPPAEGKYIVQGYVSTPLDQVEPNNNLNPTTIVVAGGPVPPPTPVPFHAAQHEEGGADELSIDGLQGRTADPQSPLAHAAQHQAGGSDALNVGSLQGVLATDQPAQVHSNTRHNPAMSTAAELTAHASSTAAHTAATNLANRETTGPETGLVKGEQLVLGSVVPASLYNALRNDRYFGPAKHASVGANLPGNLILTQSSGLATLTSVTIPANYLTDALQVIFELAGLLHIHAEPGAILVLSTWIGANQLTQIDFPVANAEDSYFHISGAAIGKSSNVVEGLLEIQTQLPTPGLPKSGIDGGGFGASYTPGSPAVFAIKADLTDAHAATTMTVYSALIRSISPIP